MLYEIPRIKFENGEITLDIFERGKSEPIVHIKGSLKDKSVRRKIALVKKEFGSVYFSDIIDFMDINFNLKDEFENLIKIKEEED